MRKGIFYFLFASFVRKQSIRKLQTLVQYLHCAILSQIGYRIDDSRDLRHFENPKLIDQIHVAAISVCATYAMSIVHENSTPFCTDEFALMKIINSR